VPERKSENLVSDFQVKDHTNLVQVQGRKNKGEFIAMHKEKIFFKNERDEKPMKKEFRLISIFVALSIVLCINPSSILAGDGAAEKVVKNFAKAYFMIDQSMAEHLNEKAFINKYGVNLVDLYIYKKTIEAQSQGYKLSFMQKKPVKMKTRVLNENGSSAQILFNSTTIRSINPLYRITGSVFGMLEEYKVQDIITVEKENGTWKIAPGAFDMPT
jgi:hypothetical protein